MKRSLTAARSPEATRPTSSPSDSRVAGVVTVGATMRLLQVQSRRDGKRFTGFAFSGASGIAEVAGGRKSAAVSLFLLTGRIDACRRLALRRRRSQASIAQDETAWRDHR